MPYQVYGTSDSCQPSRKLRSHPPKPRPPPENATPSLQREGQPQTSKKLCINLQILPGIGSIACFPHSVGAQAFLSTSCFKKRSRFQRKQTLPGNSESQMSYRVSNASLVTANFGTQLTGSIQWFSSSPGPRSLLSRLAPPPIDSLALLSSDGTGP
jgi:hypothetical protein